MFAVSSKGGLMPEWPGEVGGSPALSRNRDHHCVCCLLYTSPSPRDVEESRMPSSA